MKLPTYTIIMDCSEPMFHPVPVPLSTLQAMMIITRFGLRSKKPRAIVEGADNDA